MMNLQDVFLNQVRKEKMPVTVFLMNGFQIKGVVRGFDSFIMEASAQAGEQDGAAQQQA